MNTLLLMTNADAAKTLTIVALLVLLVIVFNIGLFIYIAIRRKGSSQPRRTEGINLTLTDSADSAAKETPAPAPAPAKSAAKPFGLFKKGRKAEGFEIVLTDIAHPERTFYAEGKSEFLVGRRPQMDLCIPDDGYVSGTHCKFEITEDNLYLTDLESSNGTKVNGNKITDRVQVTENDIVRIGKAEYRVNFQ
jgi:hypothetical protein